MSSSRIILPSAVWLPRTSPGFTTQALTASAHKVAYAFIAEATTTCNALGLRLGTITGSSPNFQIEIQGLDGAGLPDGLAIAGSSATFSPSSLGWSANTFRWLAIPGVNLTRGSVYAIVVRYASGAIDASNNASFTTTQNNLAPEAVGLPYALTDTGSGFTKTTTSSFPVFGYRNNTNTYGHPIQGWATSSLLSNGNRAALKLALDAHWGSTYTLRGLMPHWTQTAANGTFKIGVWDAAGTEIAACTLDSDHFNGQSVIRQTAAFFPSPPTLAFGGTYYFGVERVAAIDPGPRAIEVADNRDFETFPFGPSAILSTWNGSVWTETPTRHFPVSLLIEDWSKPTGGTVSMTMG